MESDIVIAFTDPLAAILAVVFIGSPIKENYGLWSPIIPAMTLPKLMPILNSRSLLLSGPHLT